MYEDDANGVAAGVDVGEPAGIFQIFGAFPFGSATNKFPLESIATPVLPRCAGAVGICANGDATKGADVGSGVGTLLGRELGASVLDGLGVGSRVGAADGGLTAAATRTAAAAAKATATTTKFVVRMFLRSWFARKEVRVCMSARVDARRDLDAPL